MSDSTILWQAYRKQLCRCTDLGLSVDVSRMGLPEDFWTQNATSMQRAYEAMSGLEAGQIANPDENRMVGHYWLRAPQLAPNTQITDAINQTHQQVKQFAEQVHSKQLVPDKASKFTDVLLIGIGGSALGPQLLADALGTRRDRMRMHFLDNTDPDGMQLVLERIGTRLKSTLVLVISKSGDTPETRNGMIHAQVAFKDKGLNFARHAIAITGSGSKLDRRAEQEQWLRRFPMWDWVGGRTSVMSAVGLVPAALQGLDIDALLHGAATMDQHTRQPDTKRNPAARLALVWRFATGGTGMRDMVILPYKDRLILLSRYLQQLVMESLGKELDLDGHQVNQGIAVYGNKGSTDQHAYVQQLRDGIENFFVTFILVQRETPRISTTPVMVESASSGSIGFTSGDFLHGFWQGTRAALYEKERGSTTITIDKLDALSLGAIIALYERAVGYYATLVHINAYHQPGVEAGKSAAAIVLDIQARLAEHLRICNPEAKTPEQLAIALGEPDHIETIYHVLEHLAVNQRLVKRRGRSYQYRPSKVGQRRAQNQEKS